MHSVSPANCAVSLLFPVGTKNTSNKQQRAESNNDNESSPGGTSDTEEVEVVGELLSSLQDTGSHEEEWPSPEGLNGERGGGGGDRRTSSSRYPVLMSPAVDDSMGCIDEEEPHQLDT